MTFRIDAQTALKAINRFAASFPHDPAEYARQVLRVRLTPQQRSICRALVKHKKLLVKASHNVGKTFLGAVLVNWFYDTFRPGKCLTTAPTDQQVRDLLWKEIRVLRGPRGGFRGPQMPRLEDGPDHWAHGFTAKDGDSFQGRHEKNVFILFDEATGVKDPFWETAESMYGGDNAFWLAIFNPTSVASPPYRESRNAKAGWYQMTLSALDHPNIHRELRGEPPVIPGAMRLYRLQEMLAKWCDPVDPNSEPDEGDIEWTPGSGKFLRPGPIADARLLGRYPRAAVDTVWSEALIQKVERTRHDLDTNWPVQIGCDVARFGDDFTEFHVKQGLCSLHHEAHNGWPITQTAGRLKQLATRFGVKGHPRNDPKKIPCMIDESGLGGGVVDLHDDFNFVGINSARESDYPEQYRNVRSQLWFTTVELAREGLIDVSRLPRDTWEMIRNQLLAPKYTIDLAGRLVVEQKEDTKETCGRSPDSADAFNESWLVYRAPNEKVTGRIT